MWRPIRSPGVFSALADPTRRDLVARLTVADATVNELAEPCDSFEGRHAFVASGMEKGVGPGLPVPRRGPGRRLSGGRLARIVRVIELREGRRIEAEGLGPARSSSSGDREGVVDVISRGPISPGTR